MNIRGFTAHTIRDQIAYLMDAKRIRRPAFEVINRLQTFTPGEQLVGTAVALRLMCESAGVSMEDVLTVAGNVIAEDTKSAFSSQLNAVRDYAAGEIKRGEETVRGATVEAVEAAMRGEYKSSKVTTYG